MKHKAAFIFLVGIVVAGGGCSGAQKKNEGAASSAASRPECQDKGRSTASSLNCQSVQNVSPMQSDEEEKAALHRASKVNPSHGERR